MDIATVRSYRRPADRSELRLEPGETFLAGGSWLYSEPQPEVTGMVDLLSLGWPALERRGDGLRIGATCTLAELAALEDPGWEAHPLFRASCGALLGSFKVWTVATVGGNLCLALPAGPMAALAVALDARLELWMPDGGTRTLDALDLIEGPGATTLRPGEVLRAIDIPAEALRSAAASRKASLRPVGRSAAFLIARRAPDGTFVLAVTAATPRPHRFRFPGIPTAVELSDAVGRIPVWYDDPHGSPDWRRAMTLRLAEELRRELAAAPNHDGDGDADPDTAADPRPVAL